MQFVALKSISPINDPATPAASPAGRGERCKMSVVVFKASSRYRSRWRTLCPAPYPSSNDPSKKEDSRIETGPFDVSPRDERRGCKLSGERLKVSGALFNAPDYFSETVWPSAKPCGFAQLVRSVQEGSMASGS